MFLELFPLVCLEVGKENGFNIGSILLFCVVDCTHDFPHQLNQSVGDPKLGLHLYVRVCEIVDDIRHFQDFLKEDKKLVSEVMSLTENNEFLVGKQH